MSVTVIVLISVAIFLILFDVYIIVMKGKAESISAYTIRAFKKSKLIILVSMSIGFVLGHLLWGMDCMDYDPEYCNKQISKTRDEK